MKKHGPIKRALKHWWLVFIFVLLWQAGTQLGLWQRNLLPSPIDVVRAIGTMMTTRVLLIDAGASVLRVIAGFALAAALGTGLGLTLGALPNLAPPFGRFIDMLRPIPPIAWIPLAILWFGVGNGSAIFIVALGAFFPIFLNTFEAVLNVKTSYINTAFCLGASRRLLYTDILLPAAAPQIMIGLRVGLGIAWTSLIAAELVGAQFGLGYMIQLNRLLLQMDNVIAGMLVIAVIGFGMNRLSYWLQQLLVPWADDTLRAHTVQGSL